MFCSFLFCSIHLFCSILFFSIFSILFDSFLFYSVLCSESNTSLFFFELVCSILFCSIRLYSILFYSMFSSLFDCSILSLFWGLEFRVTSALAGTSVRSAKGFRLARRPTYCCLQESRRNRKLTSASRASK